MQRQPQVRSHSARNWRCLFGAAVIGGTVLAPGAAASPDEPFYRQLVNLQSTAAGYRPTRSFTIVTDASQGDRLVAEDDTDLQFNLLWLDQYQPGYRSRHGGGALGQMLRDYLKTAYKAYRERNAQSLSALPDEQGNGRIKALEGEMNYRLRWSDDEVKVGFEYNY